MSIEKKLLGTTPVSGAVDPEGVSFDGTNDYLSRSSDLTGNADGKTFTFSVWFYSASTQNATAGFVWNTSGRIGVGLSGTGKGLSIRALTSADGWLIDAGANLVFALETWSHLLISIDLNNSANRYVYLNDTDITSSISWSTYNVGDISFTESDWFVASSNAGATQRNEGRLAHVFLDYTYRDLSTESNRRLFIDSDGKPSSTIPSSPILYLPMTDAATAGSNSGTGGDFTVNGVLDTAGRAPNQFNCSASTFDGTNDYLRSTTVGATDSKVVTLNFIYKCNDTSEEVLFNFEGGFRDTIYAYAANGALNMSGRGSAGETCWAFAATGLGIGRHIHVSVSTDVANDLLHVFINGVSQATTSTTDVNMNFSGVTSYSLGVEYLTSYGYLNGSLGEFYLDTAYTDLSTDNPFWDADANRPKPVRQVISETGTTPLIALPLQGNDAGNNLGTGGDFTVNSGPFTGARGGSEFWARSAKFNSSSEWLKDSSPSISDSKVFSCVCSFKRNNALGNGPLLRIRQGAGDGDQLFSLMANSNGRVYTDAYSSTQQLLGSYTGEVIVVDTWYTVFLSIDLNSTSNRSLVIEGVASPAQSWNTYVDGTVDFSSATYSSIHLVHTTSGDSSDIDVAFLYFNTAYIDFSQESNRNLFVDQLGYPKDLTPAIDAGDIADPLIYMKFDDTSALGTNSGTGGNFTVNGTVTAGADVDPN